MTLGAARHRSSGRRALLVVILALLAALLTTGAVSARSGATIVRGIQHEAGSCRDGGYAMTGALEGCWWVDTFNTRSDPDRSIFLAWGAEHFEGCMGTVCGTFWTTYTYTAKSVGPWVDFIELHGRCHHPVIRGEGGFAGASGEISFHDVVDVSPPYYPYVGNVLLARD